METTPVNRMNLRPYLAMRDIASLLSYELKRQQQWVQHLRVYAEQQVELAIQPCQVPKTTFNEC